MLFYVLLLSGILGLACISPALAKDKKPKPGKGNATRSPETAPPNLSKAELVFSPVERQIFSGYVGEKTKSPGRGRGPGFLPPGLEKKYARTGKLPPGWEKKLVRGGIMPAEVYAECRPLPGELQVRLPAPPVGTVTVCVQGKVARILAATMEILDVFDVLP